MLITAQTSHVCPVERCTELTPDSFPHTAWRLFPSTVSRKKLDLSGSGMSRFYQGLRKMRGLFHIVNRIFVNIFLRKINVLRYIFLSKLFICRATSPLAGPGLEGQAGPGREGLANKKYAMP